MFVTFEEAIDLLKNGKVVAIPTETVYGLAASIASPSAIQTIFDLKKRPSDNPLIIHVATIEQLENLVAEIPEGSRLLMKAFWPGALTIIFPANVDKVPSLARAGLNTIGIRMPSLPQTLSLIEAVGPLVAPSANLSGRPSSTTAEHVKEDFGDALPIFSGGKCSEGMESTIVGMIDGKWKIFRLGAVSAEELRKVIDVEIGTPFDVERPLSPGQKYKHYSPSCSLVLGKGEYQGSPETVVGFEGREYPAAKKVIYLGDLNDPKSIEKNLYAVLRSLDAQSIENAWVDGNFDSEGPLRTVFERLKKACSIEV